MANLSRRQAANVALFVISDSIRTQVNVEPEYVNYAAAAGIGLSDFPATDPIIYLTTSRASGAQMSNMVQTFTTLTAKTLRLNFVRTGKWSLTQNPGSTNNGQSYYNREVVKPRPGVVTTRVGYVPGFSPVAAQLVPSAPGYSIFANNQLASYNAFLALCTDINAKIQAHLVNNALSISYCHTSCHNNCHTSRGRR